MYVKDADKVTFKPGNTTINFSRISIFIIAALSICVGTPLFFSVMRFERYRHQGPSRSQTTYWSQESRVPLLGPPYVAWQSATSENFSIVGSKVGIILCKEAERCSRRAFRTTLLWIAEEIGQVKIGVGSTCWWCGPPRYYISLLSNCVVNSLVLVDDTRACRREFRTIATLFLSVNKVWRILSPSITHQIANRKRRFRKDVCDGVREGVRGGSVCVAWVCVRSGCVARV